METSTLFRWLADLVLVVHLGVVVFVIVGLLVIVIGNLRGWRWINHWGFRAAHLAAIAIVVLQSWLGMMCPLTLLESWLRARAGGAGYEAAFIEYWVGRVLFHEAPTWMFTTGYTAFGLAVVIAWWYFPPRRRRR
jgi:hypothetical protein